MTEIFHMDHNVIDLHDYLFLISVQSPYHLKSFFPVDTIHVIAQYRNLFVLLE